MNENDTDMVMTSTEAAPAAAEAVEAPEPVAVEADSTEAVESADAPTEAEATDEQPKARHKANPFQARIDELTKIRREQERRIAELEAKQAPAVEEEAPIQPQGDFEAIVNRRASEIAQQRELNGRMNSWLQAGLSEFKEDFNDRCNTVAALGAQDRPEFMQIVTDPDIIPDGHRLVAALADDPVEATRILSLPPVQMSAALVRYSEKVATPKAKPISSAPAPIKPLDGTARASDEPSASDSEDEWFRKRQAQIHARARKGANF